MQQSQDMHYFQVKLQMESAHQLPEYYQTNLILDVEKDSHGTYLELLSSYHASLEYFLISLLSIKGMRIVKISHVLSPTKAFKKVGI